MSKVQSSQGRQGGARRSARAAFSQEASPYVSGAPYQPLPFDPFITTTNHIKD